jgi:hypothetical protein
MAAQGSLLRSERDLGCAVRSRRLVAGGAKEAWISEIHEQGSLTTESG